MNRYSSPRVTGTVNGVDFDARYTVAGMRGVAFWLHGWDQEEIPGDWELACEDANCLHETEDCYVWHDPEIVDRAGYVRAIMVGDNYEHVVDSSDLTVISEDDYCGGCGQTGCRAYG